MKKERFEAITDAILAIIITLMVLEIKIPELTLKNIPAVLQLILIYGISFTYIAILWLNHHHIFVHAKKIGVNMVWINFALLFFTSLLPLATEHLSADFHEKANHVFFGAVICIMTLIYAVIQQHVMKQSNQANQHTINKRNWFAVALFALSIPLCFLSVFISGAIFIILPTVYFLISRKVIN